MHSVTVKMLAHSIWPYPDMIFITTPNFVNSSGAKEQAYYDILWDSQILIWITLTTNKDKKAQWDLTNEHLNSNLIWVANFHLFGIQMVANWMGSMKSAFSTLENLR